MKRVVNILLLIMMLVSSISITAYAEDNSGVQSLDEVTGANQQATEIPEATATPEASSSSVENTAKNTNNLFNSLSKAADMSEKNENIEKSASILQRVITYAVQILSYIATYGLTLRVVLDLIYIGVPFLRNILSNGHIGNPQAGAGGVAQQPGMMGMGGMGMGGMGMGGMGMGGYGMNRGMGGMLGSPMMGGMGNPMMAGQEMSHQQAPGVFNKIQWISNAALNAVAGEITLGPDGKPVSPMKMYIKDMLVVLIVTPILLILAVSGSLTQLGFLIGGAAVKMLGNIGGGLQ